MSLGPPFDASGTRLQQRVGAVVVVLLLGAIAWVLVFSGRTLGRGTTFRVEMASTGPLHVGAKVMLAGREVGEVRAVDALPTRDGLHVDFVVFVERAWAREVRKNSQLIVATPSVLGEAYLEVAPPANGAEPGPPIVDGERLRGADPPDLDRFFVHAEASIREVLALLREQRPALDELLQAGDSLLATLSGLPADRGQLHRIVDQAEQALDAGQALFSTVREAGGVARLKRIGADLSAIADRVGPDLTDLGARLDRAMSGLDRLRDLVPSEKRAQAREAIERLRRVVTIGERLLADVRALEKKVRDGEGTIGGLLGDREIFDDLHETHRIIKSMPLRFLLKTIPPKEPIGPKQ